MRSALTPEPNNNEIPGINSRRLPSKIFCENKVLNNAICFKKVKVVMAFNLSVVC